MSVQRISVDLSQFPRNVDVDKWYRTSRELGLLVPGWVTE